MSRYTLGIDTSNYATSLAVFDTAGEVVCAKKRFLPVKEGQLGLRQRDALFHHTTALPEMLEELSREFDLTQIAAVGVSQEELLRAADYLEGESQTGIPIYGTVAAGLPINAYEDILGTVRIDYALPGDPEDYFALRVRGTSMDAAHIPDGSLIIVKKTRQIEEGQIGVFLVGGEATVKVFARKEDHIILIPQSTDTEHLPQIYDATDEVSVLGRVVRSVVSMPCSV